jgi:hypothetical protein
VSKREPKYTQKGGATDRFWLRKTLFKGFSPLLLGLENILAKRETFEALAVIIDLKCKPPLKADH